MKATLKIILPLLFLTSTCSLVSGQVLKARADFERKRNNSVKSKGNSQLEIRDLIKRDSVKGKIPQDSSYTIMGEFTKSKTPQDSSSTKAFDASGFGNFIFGNATTVQSLNLLASLTSSDTFNMSKKNWVPIYNVNARLYGLQKASTLKQDSVGLALLIPENSQWGIQLSLAAIALKMRTSKAKTSDLALAGGVRFDYTSKNINVRDSAGEVTSNYQIGQFLIRPGLEVAYKSLLSIYGNWNWNAIVTGVDDFKKAFNKTPVTNFTYYDFGLRGVFALTKDSKTTINLDFNFIYMNDNLKILYNTNDSVIPLIRLGLSQSLYFK